MPPLTGVAVNVTFVPADIEPPGLAEMLTLATTVGFTDIVIVPDVAVAGEAQEKLEVRMQ